MARPIGVAVLGTGWMARAHTRALHTLQTIDDLPARIRLVGIAGRDPLRTAEAGRRWGFGRATTEWRELVEADDVDIVVNLTGNHMHADPSIAALELDKHVLCEKPLATSLSDIVAMTSAANASDAVAACGYNYRFVPALRLARQLLRDGQLGTLTHARFGYEQDWALRYADRHGWRFEDPVGGSCVYDLSHILDLMRWIVGEPSEVIGVVATRDNTSGSRHAQIGTDPEDSYDAIARLAGGASVSVGASRIATGRKGRQYIELTGTDGALMWDMEDLNRLRVSLESDRPSGIAGFRDVLVTEPDHPFMRNWYAAGHTIGWDDTVVHQWISLVAAISDGPLDVPTDFATFEDGARAIELGSAIRASAASRSWQSV